MSGGSAFEHVANAHVAKRGEKSFPYHRAPSDWRCPDVYCGADRRVTEPFPGRPAYRIAFMVFNGIDRVVEQTGFP